MDAWSATLRGDEARLKELLRLDLHRVDALNGVTGQSVLHLACAQGNEAIVGFLLRKGADPDVPDAVLGETALHKAAARGLARAAQMLVAVGADRDAIDRRGRRPIDLARKYGDALTIRIIGESEARHARNRGNLRVADLLENVKDAPEIDRDLEQLRTLEKRCTIAHRASEEYRAALRFAEDDLRDRDDNVDALENTVRRLRGDLERVSKRADKLSALEKDLRAADDRISRLQAVNARLQRDLDSERARRQDDRKMWQGERDRFETKVKKQYEINLELQRDILHTARDTVYSPRDR